MEEIKLDVLVRNEVGSRKTKKVRREEKAIPGVVYGSEVKTTPIKIDRRAFEGIMKTHRGQNVIFHLNILEGTKKLSDYPAIIKEEQIDPVDDHLVHIDFKRISLTEEIEVKVPIEAKGDAIGVKQDGGSLEHVLWTLTVTCLPTNIPQKITIDVSALKIGDAIHVRELALPAGVKTKQDPDSIVVTVVPPMKEVEATPVGEAPLEPELIKKKEKVEEGEGEAEGGAAAAKAAPAKEEKAAEKTEKK